MTNDDLDALLKHDPLDAAEKLTGEQWGGELGMLAAFSHNNAKEQALKAAGDTTFSTRHPEFVAILARSGFRPIYQKAYGDVTRHYAPGKTYEELHTIWWRPDGVLVEIETYDSMLTDGTRVHAVNSAHAYYNVDFGETDDERVNPWSVLSSGHYNAWAWKHEGKRVWVGYHDVREGLVHKLEKLAETGAFLSEWVERPYLYFTPYHVRDDSLGYKEQQAAHDAQIAAVVAEFPTEVAEKVSP